MYVCVLRIITDLWAHAASVGYNMANNNGTLNVKRRGRDGAGRGSRGWWWGGARKTAEHAAVTRHRCNNLAEGRRRRLSLSRQLTLNRIIHPPRDRPSPAGNPTRGVVFTCRLEGR